MERVRLLFMTAILTVLIWAAADNLVTEVGTIGVVFRLVPPSNMLVQLNAAVERFDVQVSGPRRTVEAVQAHGTYNVHWAVEERPTGETAIPLDRLALKNEMADQWGEFSKLAIVSIQPGSLPVMVDHVIPVEADLVMNRLSLEYDLEPQLQRLTVSVRMRESTMATLPTGQRLQIDMAPEVERLLRDQPVGRSVTLRAPLDARRFGPDAEITPNNVEFTAAVRSQRVTEKISTVPVFAAMSFGNLDKRIQAVTRDGTPLTLLTQTIQVTGMAEEVQRLVRGETRAFGVIQIKEDDLQQIGRLMLATPEYHLPKGLDLAADPPVIEFQLTLHADGATPP